MATFCPELPGLKPFPQGTACGYSGEPPEESRKGRTQCTQESNGRSRESNPPPAGRNLKLGNRKFEIRLQLLEKLASRTGNVNPARNTAHAVLHALYDARRFAALWAIRALARIHYFFPVRRLCNLSAYCHGSFLLISIAQLLHSIFVRILVDGCGRKLYVAEAGPLLLA